GEGGNHWPLLCRNGRRTMPAIPSCPCRHSPPSKESPVPIIAVCPYCQTGRVRAPEQAVGQATVCPRCHASFTVIDSGETEEVARRRVATPSVPTPRPIPDSEPIPLDQTPTAVNETTAVIPVPRRIPTPAPVPVADDEETAGPDPVRVAT